MAANDTMMEGAGMMMAMGPNDAICRLGIGILFFVFFYITNIFV